MMWHIEEASSEQKLEQIEESIDIADRAYWDDGQILEVYLASKAKIRREHRRLLWRTLANEPSYLKRRWFLSMMINAYGVHPRQLRSILGISN